MTTSPPTEVYAATRHRLIAWFRTLDGTAAATVVPACPAWTVRDTVAHVIGIVDDILHDRTDGLGSDGWTAAQVERRAGRGLGELCDEWESLAAGVDAFTAADPWFGTRLVADLVTHEHDLRAALGQPGARDSDAVHLGLQRYAPAFVERAAHAGLGPVAVLTGDRRWGANPGDAAVALHGAPFDVLRALTGRRSTTQVAAMEWSGADPAPYLPLVSPYGQPAEPLVE
ncbi:MAG: maleylpyruvate isomerase family mycothiol-dependent enzyme [Acidimicrobiales bacterium]|nr:maleylpyruvate isomerase family mycothiol-dependent enzyme [Acidimicrobiales bacterium]